MNKDFRRFRRIGKTSVVQLESWSKTELCGFFLNFY